MMGHRWPVLGRGLAWLGGWGFDLWAKHFSARHWKCAHSGQLIGPPLSLQPCAVYKYTTYHQTPGGTHTTTLTRTTITQAISSVST